MAKAWLYCLESDYTLVHPLLNGIEFENEWLTIANGRMIVRLGYAWDGCTPRYHFFGLLTVGVPNGVLRLGKPWTYFASLIHDVFCQFRHLIRISKQAVVQIFNDILERDKWPLRPIYVAMVDRFGPQDFLVSS